MTKSEDWEQYAIHQSWCIPTPWNLEASRGARGRVESQRSKELVPGEHSRKEGTLRPKLQAEFRGGGGGGSGG